MAISSTGAAAARFYPVKALKEQVVALDAAMLVCVTSAEVGAVHRLRTSIRRVEALLLLLELLGGGESPLTLPEHVDEAAEVRRRLRRIRRSGGVVRDLDVQADAIWFDAPAKTAVHKGTPGDEVRKQAKKLRKRLREQREREAERLIGVLREEEEGLAAAMRVLEQKLKPAVRKTAAAAVVLERSQGWFTQQVTPLLRVRRREGEDAAEAQRRALESVDGDSLHAIRKAAKMCRYMCEAAKAAQTQAAAVRFEALQETAGKWHDWLLLEGLAHDLLGKRAALTTRYAMHRDAALSEVHLRMVELLPAVTSA